LGDQAQSFGVWRGGTALIPAPMSRTDTSSVSPRSLEGYLSFKGYPRNPLGWVGSLQSALQREIRHAKNEIIGLQGPRRAHVEGSYTFVSLNSRLGRMKKKKKLEVWG